MNFREWLPVTRRNRIALGLAGLALVIFVIWNCLPIYPWDGAGADGRVMQELWPEVFSPDIYVGIIRAPDIEDFLSIAAYFSLVQNALVTFLAVPFWKLLGSSPYIRLPLAILNLMGGSVILWHLIDSGLADDRPLIAETLALISMSMLALSASLFTFRNELGLRSEKEVREVSGKGGAA